MLVAAVWILVGTALGAQPTDELSFADATEVRAVHLDVLVLDRDGRPLRDLGRDDFRVEEDGRAVELDFFRSVVEPSEPARRSDTVDPGDVAAAMTAGPAGPVEWIVYLDDLRLDGGVRERVAEDLERVFTDWEQGGTLRLVIQRGEETIERGPFEDPAALVAAIADRPKGSVRGVMSKIARRQAMERLVDVRQACALSGRNLCVDCWNEQLSVATRHAVDEVDRVQRTSLHLKNLLVRLDPSQGRRVLLYVGDGLPLLAGAAVLWSLGDLCSDRRSEVESEVQQFRMQSALEEVAALANAQRTAFHMLDAGGLRDSQGPNDVEHVRNLQAGLQTLAEQTGGSAILNANRSVDPVRSAALEESVRYELGYTLSRPPTGRLHRIEVSLRDAESARGRTLRYRRTYWDRTSDMRLRQLLEVAASGDPVPSAAGDDELALRLAPEGAQRVEGERRRREVVLQIAISEALAVVVPVADRVERGQVSLAIQVGDAEGRGGEPRLRQVALGSGALQAVGGWYFVEVGVEVQRGENSFTVAVRDEVSGAMRTGRLVARVP